MKSLIKFIGVCLIGLLILPNYILAQPPGGEFYVKGIVFEEKTSTPMEYVTVVLYSMRDSSIISGTITDSKGHFNIKLNRPGKYYLTADFIGFEKQTIENVLVKPGNETVNLGSLSLKPAMVGIDEVEVVAEKPFVSYKLDRKVVEVSRNPSAQGGTAVDALENVPSIDIDIEGNVAVRGSSDFTVLIDGRQSPLTGSDALNQIPASAIDQIEIITNPSAKYDPDGTGGIINIITKKGKLNGHSMVVNASVGSSPQASSDITYSYKAKKYTLTGSVGYRDSRMSFNHYNKRTTTEIDTTPKELGESYIYTDRDGEMSHGNYFFKGAIDYNLTESNTFSLGGSYNKFHFGRSFDSKNHSISLGDTNTYELSSTDFGVNPGTWQLNIGDRHIFNDNKDNYISVDLMYQWRKNEAIDELLKYEVDSSWGISLPDSIYNYQRAITAEDANRMRLEVNYSLPIYEDAIFEAGYTYRSDAYTQNYSQLFKENKTDTWIPNGESNDIAEFERYIHAGWVVLRGKFSDIQYSAGLRLEHTDRTIKTQKDNWNYTYNYLGWYPSLSLAKEWGNGHTLQTSYSKRINRPRDYHLNPFSGLSDGYTQHKPNPELQPEYASSVELNYQKNWGQSFLAVETFYRHTENEMDRITEVSGDTLIRTMINLGSESDAGGELAVNVKIAKWWTFNPMATISYNMAEGTYLNNYSSVSSTNYRGSLNNNFFLPSKTRIQLMSYYRGARKEIDGTRKPSYWFSAAVRQDFFDRKLSATLRVDDIFATRKREGETISENTTVYSVGQRKSPTVVFSLSYKLNPTKERKRNGGENGGGMDMDF